MNPTLRTGVFWVIFSAWIHAAESEKSFRTYIIEGSLEVKLPTIWTDEKQSREEAERRERLEERRVRRKKMQMREKVGKSRNTVFFQWFGAPEGRKVGSLKRRVRSQLARWEMKNCTPLWREAHFQVKMYKTHQARTTFGSWEVEKVHAAVARSTFRSQNAQNTSLSDHFWQLRCRKSARRCSAKHISKSKCTKHTSFGALLEVEMSKKCTRLWREAHFQVKMYKTPQRRTTFESCDVEKSARRRGVKHISKSKCTKHTMFGALLEVEMSKKCTPLWREAHLEVKMLKTLGFRTTSGGSDVASLRFGSLHYTTVHYTILHSTTLQLQLQNYTTTLHYTPLRSTTLNYTTLHHNTLHSTTLHYTTLHYLPLHFTTLHPTTPHYNYNYDYTTTLHYTPLH